LARNSRGPALRQLADVFSSLSVTERDSKVSKCPVKGVYVQDNLCLSCSVTY
jgi:hypothetical protein